MWGPKRRVPRAVRTIQRRPYIPKTRAMAPGSLGGANKVNVKLHMSLLINDTLPAAISGVGQAHPLVQARLNDLFDVFTDPPVSIQPVGYDQFAALYNRYKVKSCRVTYQLAHAIPSGTEFRPVRLLVKLGTGSFASVGNTYEEMDQKSVVSQYLNVQGDITHGSFTYDMREVFQENPLEDNKGAIVTAVPAQNAYWQLIAFGGNGSVTTVVTGHVRFDFEVEFSQRKNTFDA